MLLTPADQPFDYRKLPRLSLALSMLLLILFAWLVPLDNTRTQTLTDFYQQHLLAIEWPLYPTHLMQTQQMDKLTQLQAAYEQKDNELLASQIGNDRRFYQSIATKAGDYLEPDLVGQWSQDRQQYNEQRDHLSTQVLGLDNQRFRPITFITHAFVEHNATHVLLAVLVLLCVGMALEQTMGSGALLCAWLVGSISAGIGFMATHYHSVTPLIGSSGAIAGVLGLAFMRFLPAHSLRLFNSHHTISGWAVLAVFIALTGIHFVDDWDIGLAISSALAFASGMLVNLGYQRWFATQTVAEEAPSVADTMPTDETYRQELHNILNKISTMQFATAEQQLRTLAESYPGDKRVLEHLYHLVKFKPTELEFEEISSGLFNLPIQPGANQLVLSIYNDYKHRSKTFVALDHETGYKLAMRFARIQAFKEAEEVFKRSRECTKPTPLLRKAAQALSQAFSAVQQEQRARQYQQIAEKEANLTRA